MSESGTEEDKNKDPGPTRRRGVVFWLFLSFLLVLAMPLLLYLGVLAYVACGFLDARTTQTFSTFFDAPAKVAAVGTDWLRNLKIEKIVVAPPSVAVTPAGTPVLPPLTVDKITLDWDLGPFLADKRVRTVTIEHPQIALRRDADGNWNLHPNLPRIKGAYHLEQIILREGGLSIEWDNRSTGVPPVPAVDHERDARGTARLSLQALSGTFSDQGPLTPKAFSLYGVFDSLESISLTGSYDPGGAWNCRVFGGVNLERDLAGVLAGGNRQPISKGPVDPGRLAAGGVSPRPAGHVRYDISGWHEAPATQSRGETVAFSSQFILENLHWPLGSAGRALDIPNRIVDLGGAARLSPAGTDSQSPESRKSASAPAELAAFDKLQLRVDGVGTLNGQGALLSLPGILLTLQAVRGRVDLDAVNELFQPRLWGDAVGLKGALTFSGLAGTVPLAGAAPPPSLKAEFATQGLRAALRGLGDLPQCDVKGELALGPESGDGKVRAITVQADLHTLTAKPADEAHLKIKQSYFPDEEPSQRIGVVEIEEGVWPLSALERVFELRRTLGLTGNGTVRLRNATLDPATGEARGTIELENVDLVAALPRGAQEAALSMLKLSSYGFAAPLFEKNPIDAVSFVGLNAQFDAQLKDKRLTLRNGRSRPFEFKVELPWVSRTIQAALPAAELEGELDLLPKPDGRPSELKLKLATGTKLEMAFKPVRPGIPAAWVISGALETPALGGLSATLSLALDLSQRQVGPVTVRLKELDLAKVQALLLNAGIERPVGRIKDLVVNLEPYSLRSLAADKVWDANALIEEVGFSNPYVEAKGMTGEGHLRVSSSNGSVDLNAILRLRKHGELTCRNAFSVPSGQDGFLRFVGKYKGGEKGPETRLELLQAKLGAFAADIKGDPERAITWAELLAKLKKN